MARFKYLTDEEVAPEQRAQLRNINLTRLLFHNPELARLSNQHAMYIRNKSKLDPRLREMAILQVGYLTRSAYEYSHHIKIGRDFGVSDDDIRAIADEAEGRPTSLAALDRAVLRGAREMTRDLAISDETFAVLSRSLDAERITDLVLTIGFYNAVVRILASLQIDVESEYLRYLEEFPLPQS